MFKENKTPKISANKLGEYLDSSALRRHIIVKDQKYPKGFIVTRYNDARWAITNFFVDGKGNKELIEQKIEELILKSYNSNFRNQDKQLSIKALKVLSTTEIDLDFNSVTITRPEKDLSKLPIEGVSVSIQPEILINGKIKGKEFVGAIKIHISRTNPLNSTSGRYVSTLLHQYLEGAYPNQKVRPEFCITFDIFTGQYFPAPRSFTTLRKHIKAACNEIKLLWASL